MKFQQDITKLQSRIIDLCKIETRNLQQSCCAKTIKFSNHQALRICICRNFVCVCAYVCVCECPSVCAIVFPSESECVSMYVHVCTRTCTHMCVRAYVCMYVCSLCERMYACMCVGVCACMCVSSSLNVNECVYVQV